MENYSSEVMDLFIHSKYGDEQMYKNSQVDAVYLWCDGEDPNFIAERAEREMNYKKNQKDSLFYQAEAMREYLDPEKRYKNNDELKYSLRSLEKYAPWINHIFIITNNQKPAWLRNNNKITIVDHADIIPKHLLPTFNSTTIEQYIININGLSEKFILLNDDMFFNKETPKSVFFEDEKPIVYLQEPWDSYISSYQDAEELKERKASPYLKSVLNGYLLMQSHGRPFIDFRCPTHCIDAYSKSILLSIFKDYSELYDINTYPFRNPKEIVRAFWLLEMAYFYNCPLKIHGFPKKILDRLLFKFGLKKIVCYEFQAGYATSRFKDLIRNLEKYDPYFFCCNNLTGVVADRVIKYLERRFPEKSSFEI